LYSTRVVKQVSLSNKDVGIPKTGIVPAFHKEREKKKKREKLVLSVIESFGW